MTNKLQWLYDNPDERRAMAKRGMDYARACSWSTAVDNAVIAIEKAVSKKKSTGFQLPAQNAIISPANKPPVSVDGVSEQVALLEAS